MSSKTSPARRPLWRRLLSSVGLIILGIIIYLICINVFAGYPQFHTGLITWIVIVALALLAGVLWIVDERRALAEADEDDDD